MLVYRDRHFFCVMRLELEKIQFIFCPFRFVKKNSTGSQVESTVSKGKADIDYIRY